MISTTAFVILLVICQVVFNVLFAIKLSDIQGEIKELTSRIGELEEKTKSIVLED